MCVLNDFGKEFYRETRLLTLVQGNLINQQLLWNAREFHTFEFVGGKNATNRLNLN